MFLKILLNSVSECGGEATKGKKLSCVCGEAQGLPDCHHDTVFAVLRTV